MTNHLQVKIHTKEEFDKGRSRIFLTDWPEAEKTFHLECISAYENLNDTLREKAIAISNLKQEAFGTSDERKSTLFPEPAHEGTQANSPEPENFEANESDQAKELVAHAAALQSQLKHILNSIPPEKPSKKGHGKRDLKLFAGEGSSACAHEAHAKGDACPECKTGRLSPFKPQQKTVIHSVNLVVVQTYELQSLKCASCDAVTTAKEPDDVKAAYGRYHPSAIAQFANLRYLFGMPSHRLERFTELQGLRVPETTQFRLFEYACRVIAPLYRLLAKHAANGKISFRDDSPNRINELKRRLKKGKNDDELKAISTTVFTSILRDGNRVTLYSTNNLHAGHVIDSLLEMRLDGEPAMLAMADALSANRKHDQKNKAIELNCLVHARRNFAKIAKFYPKEVETMLDLFGDLYGVDAHAKIEKLTMKERLLIHKEKSLVVLNTMMVLAQVEKKKHDEKSTIYAAYQYIENHWPRLIGFIKYEAAPLDNSAAERDVKSAIRYRNNSLFYATVYGAFVGDVLMSVLKTAQNNGINPVSYLSYMLCNSDEVKKSPEQFLPWKLANICQVRAA